MVPVELWLSKYNTDSRATESAEHTPAVEKTIAEEFLSIINLQFGLEGNELPVITFFCEVVLSICWKCPSLILLFGIPTK